MQCSKTAATDFVRGGSVLMPEKGWRRIVDCGIIKHRHFQSRRDVGPPNARMFDALYIYICCTTFKFATRGNKNAENVWKLIVFPISPS